MDSINNFSQVEEDLEDEQQIAQLNEISAEEQAHSQLGGTTSPVTETDNIPENKYPGPVVRGERTNKSFGAVSRVDLTNKENEKKMWEEYNTWWRMRPGDDEVLQNEKAALRNSWYLNYYGMTHDEYSAKRDEQRKQYYNPLNRLHNTIKGITELSMGASTDPLMDAVGMLPGLSVLDDFYDRRTKSDTEAMQRMRSMLSIVVPSIVTGNIVTGQLQNYL